jgi:beta-lactamase superfamily II metal-dependent hydrolase
MTDNHFLRLHTLQAGYGDCLVIEYGDDPKRPHIVIIDGGVGDTTTKALKKLLKGWPDAQLELLVVSHIDDDHIVGAIRLLQDKTLRARIKDIWFNGATQRLADLEHLGFKKGDKLEEMLASTSLKLPWNTAFKGSDAVVDLSAAVEPVRLPLGASITLLSPTIASLRALRDAWEKHGLESQKEETEEAAAQSGPDIVASDLEPMGASDIPRINVDELLKTSYKEDQSVTNGSSIAFLFNFGEGSILLAADAHSSVLLESSAVIYSGKPCNVDVFKLPHHGSAANVTVDLLKAFPSQTYVVSTNGGKHEHPNDLAIARIVDVAQGSKVLFNYPNDAYKRWLDFSKDNSGVLHIDSVGIETMLKVEVKVSK